MPWWHWWWGWSLLLLIMFAKSEKTSGKDLQRTKEAMRPTPTGLPEDYDNFGNHSTRRCRDRPFVSMFLVNDSYHFWHDTCKRPPEMLDYHPEDYEDQNESAEEEEAEARAGADYTPSPGERTTGDSAAPKSCRAQCNLVLHKRGCLNVDGQWHGGLCSQTISARGCIMERFVCSEYHISALQHALRFCDRQGSQIRECSMYDGGGCEYPAALRSPDEWDDLDKEGQCVRSILQRHADYDNASTDDMDEEGAVDHSAHAPLVLPLSEIGLGLANGGGSSQDTGGVLGASDFYIKTYAIHEGIFDFLKISLSDPYMILLKDFVPCMTGLLEFHRAAIIYLPEESLLVEFGHTNTSVDTMAVCTLGSFDHRFKVRYILMTVATGLSISGLVLTIISALLTREHLNIPGVNLLCLSASLATVYVTVVVASLSRDIGDRCLPEGILHVYGVLASLTWMNLMAFDIWNTLSKTYPMEESLSLRNRRKLALYALYGWGAPVLLFSVGVAADHLDIVPATFKPHFTIQCWFFEFNTWGTVLFYHGPIGVIMLANLTMFLLTARILQHTNYNASKYGLRTYRKARYLFRLYIKLFLVMGFTWILEISNLVISTPEILMANDFINTLQGFFIFIIFACKPHVLRAVAFYCCPRRCFRGIRRSNTRPPAFHSSSMFNSASRRSYSLEHSNSCQTLNCTKDKKTDNILELKSI